MTSPTSFLVLAVNLLVLASTMMFNVGARAAAIATARIDGKRGVLVLRVVTSDCNSLRPALQYDSADSRAYSAPVYRLEFSTSRGTCSSQNGSPRSVTLEVMLPQRRPGETVIIKTEDEKFEYAVAQKQKDQFFEDTRAAKSVIAFRPPPEPQPQPQPEARLSASR